jgi:hypothetical protein
MHDQRGRRSELTDSDVERRIVLVQDLSCSNVRYHQFGTACSVAYKNAWKYSSGKAGGVASYMRIDPANGCIEVGGIKLTPLVARKPAMTEAMHLMMKNAFDLGYRRHEWKCDALNLPSRAAAQRFGFSYEGCFQQAVIYKNRNRDTAWFSITDLEWPAIRAAHEQWLAPENFDAQGRQKSSLSAPTAPLLRAQS